MTEFGPKIYSLGARNLLLFNIPPLHRTPATTVSFFDPALSLDWNQRLAALSAKLTHKYSPNLTLFAFDTYAFWNQVMYHPASIPQTAVYQNTTEHCWGYTRETNDTLKPECGVRHGEYLWHDPLHLTWPLQDALASQVALLLEGKQSVFDIS